MAEAAVCEREARSREIRVMKRGRASDAIGSIDVGCEIYILTMGQFSLIDALWCLLDQTGPATVDVCTWTVEGADLERMIALSDRGLITGVRWILDRSWIGRRLEFCERLVEVFGADSLRTCQNHAKFLRIKNDRWDLAVRTSMNLNENPRMEHIEISEDPVLGQFLGQVTDALFDERDPGTVSGLPDLEAVRNDQVVGMLDCFRLLAPRLKCGQATSRRLTLGAL